MDIRGGFLSGNKKMNKWSRHPNKKPTEMSRC